MNDKPLVINIFSLLFLLAVSAQAKTDLQPVLLVSKGEVSYSEKEGESKPAELKKGIKVGSTVSTGADSKAVLAIAPGQLVTMRENTSVKLISSGLGKEDGEAIHYGEIEIVTGKITCTIVKAKGVKHKFRMGTGTGDTIDAIGTSWSTSSNGGVVQTTVTSGTIVMTSSSGATVTIPPGNVIISAASSDGSAPAPLVIVNLVTGVTTTFSGNGAAPVTSPATATQLAAASAAFSAAIAAVPSGTLPAAEVSSLTTLVSNVNSTLSSAGLPKLESGSLPVDSVSAAVAETPASNTSNNATETVSPTTPRR